MRKRCNCDIGPGPASRPLRKERSSRCPTEPPRAHTTAAPVQQLSSEIRGLVVHRFVGTGEPSPAPRANSLHLTVNKLWPSAFSILSDKIHLGSPCIKHHPCCYSRTGESSPAADESLVPSSFPRSTSFQCQGLSAQPCGKGGWEAGEVTTLSWQTASPSMQLHPSMFLPPPALWT